MAPVRRRRRRRLCGRVGRGVPPHGCGACGGRRERRGRARSGEALHDGVVAPARGTGDGDGQAVGGQRARRRGVSRRVLNRPATAGGCAGGRRRNRCAGRSLRSAVLCSRERERQDATGRLGRGGEWLYDGGTQAEPLYGCAVRTGARTGTGSGVLRRRRPRRRGCGGFGLLPGGGLPGRRGRSRAQPQVRTQRCDGRRLLTPGRRTTAGLRGRGVDRPLHGRCGGTDGTDRGGRSAGRTRVAGRCGVRTPGAGTSRRRDRGAGRGGTRNGRRRRTGRRGGRRPFDPGSRRRWGAGCGAGGRGRRGKALDGGGTGYRRSGTGCGRAADGRGGASRTGAGHRGAGRLDD